MPTVETFVFFHRFGCMISERLLKIVYSSESSHSQCWFLISVMNPNVYHYSFPWMWKRGNYTLTNMSSLNLKKLCVISNAHKFPQLCWSFESHSHESTTQVKDAAFSRTWNICPIFLMFFVHFCCSKCWHAFDFVIMIERQSILLHWLTFLPQWLTIQVFSECLNNCERELCNLSIL